MDSVRGEALALHRRGHEVHLFAVEDGDTSRDLIGWSGPVVHLSPSRGPARFSYAPGILRDLLSIEPEVVLSHGLWRYTSRAVAKWARASGKPYVVSSHGMLDLWAVRNSRWRKRIAAVLFERRHLADASCIRALCQPEADAVRDYGLANAVAVIPNGVEVPDLRASVPAPPWADVEGYGGAKILLSLGRLHPKKNLRSLLQAWANLERTGAQAFGDWRLVIAGWDESAHAEELKKWAEELGLSRSVWFAGPLFGAEKAAALRNATGFIIPSLSEGLPMVVLEAWSFSLPVLMTVECNLPEGFDLGAALKIGTTAATIGDGIVQLIEASPSKRAGMGASGRQLVESRFTWSEIGAKTEALLRWIVKGDSQPTFTSLK